MQVIDPGDVKILPCPFCGSPGVFSSDYYDAGDGMGRQVLCFNVRCTDDICKVIGPTYADDPGWDAKTLALISWNHRVQNERRGNVLNDDSVSVYSFD